MQRAGGRRTFSSTPDEGRSSTSRTTGGEEEHIFNIVTSRRKEGSRGAASGRKPALSALGGMAMKRNRVLGLSLVFVSGVACKGSLYGVGMLYVWNGTDRSAEISVAGRSS